METLAGSPIVFRLCIVVRLRIDEHETVLENRQNGVTRHAFGNTIAWLPNATCFVLAVGTPGQWNHQILFHRQLSSPIWLRRPFMNLESRKSSGLRFSAMFTPIHICARRL